MTNINNLNSKNKKRVYTKVIVGFLILSSFFIFNGFWVDLIDTYWVNPYISKLDKFQLIASCVVFAIAIIAYYWLVLKFEKIISNARFITVLLVLIIHTICRISGKWDYHSPYYLDFVIGLLFLSELYFLKKNHHNEEIIETESEKLEYDKELKEYESDSYNRAPFIKSTSGILKNSFYNDGSFAIGITGYWGSGKSSFMKLLKANNKSNTDKTNGNIDADIILEFNPWYCKSANDIINEFFKMYKKEISIYDPSINSDLTKYANTLIDYDNNKYINLLACFIDLSRKDIQSQYDSIKKRLAKLKLRVVIYIDDLDRLDCSEVMEVLRLIRNLANFPYTQFIVAYDKDYIIDCIDKNNIPRASEYLCKIINTEITLPKYEERIICKELLDRLIKILENHKLINNSNKDLDIIHKNEIEEIAFMSVNSDQIKENIFYLVPKVLRSARDVIRFSNAFQISIKPLTGDYKIISIIDIPQFILLELLRYKWCNIYESLKNNPLFLLTIDLNNKSFHYKYVEDDDQGEEKIKTILNINDSKDLKVIHLILCRLFYPDSETQSTNKINNIRHYISYFSFRVDDKALYIYELLSIIHESAKNDNCSISNSNLKLLFNKYNNDLRTSIDNCFYHIKKKEIESMTDSTLFSFIKELISLRKGQISFEAFSSASHYFKRYELSNEISTEKDFWDMLDLWVYIINNVEFILSQYEMYLDMLAFLLYNNNLPSVIINNEEYIEKAIEILKRIKKPYLIADRITLLLHGYPKQQSSEEYSLAIPFVRIKEILFEYLREYLKKIQKIDDNAFTLFRTCRKEMNFETSDIIISEEAVELMNNFAHRDPSGYLRGFIEINLSDTKNKYVLTLSQLHQKVFSSHDDCETFLMREHISGLRILERCRNFWKLYKANDYEAFDLSVNNNDDINTTNFSTEINMLDELLDIKAQYEKIIHKKNDDKQSSISIGETMKLLITLIDKLDINTLGISFKNDLGYKMGILKTQMEFEKFNIDIQ